jgi:hypothetical protein
MAGFSGEPHVLVSADTHQKSLIVNSLKPLMEITIEYQPILQAPAAGGVRACLAVALAKAGQSKITDFAKQSQFTGCQKRT